MGPDVPFEAKVIGALHSATFGGTVAGFKVIEELLAGGALAAVTWLWVEVTAELGDEFA